MLDVGPHLLERDLAAGVAALGGEAVTLTKLLAEMTDLAQLADYPDPPFVTRQFSSFERTSDDPKKPATWFANHDRGFVLYSGVLREDTPFYRGDPAHSRPGDGTMRRRQRGRRYTAR